VRVFSVGPCSVQLDWHRLARGRHEVVVGADGDLAVIEGDGGPAALLVEGLPPDRSLPVRVDGTVVGTATTLAPPAGPVLSRIATLNDLHVGEVAIGHLPRCHSRGDWRTAHPVVCLEAALAEVRAWQPDLLVLKGDLTDDDQPAQYEHLAEVLEGFPAPILLMGGNHDGGNHRSAGGPTAVLDGPHRTIVDDVDHVDLPGLRVVGLETVWPGHDRGAVRGRLPKVAEALRSAPGPVLLTLHHQLMPRPVPHYVPPGLVGREASDLLAAVAAANPATFLTSGHSHRHRVRRHGPLVVTEVGSTKDYPGTWAGYEVHAGGIVQVVRRISDPVALRWTERTARTALTMWGRWAPGRLADRCFVHHWPSR
jgi:3',5'-cyclic AMP phosphodiesterase CpdA